MLFYIAIEKTNIKKKQCSFVIQFYYQSHTQTAWRKYTVVFKNKVATNSIGHPQNQRFCGKGANERTRVKLQSNFRLSVVCDAVWSRNRPKNLTIFREPELRKNKRHRHYGTLKALPRQKRRFFSWCGRWKPAP